MISKEEARRIVRERDDRAMLLHPCLWSYWPFICLKRPSADKSADTDHAFLIEPHDGKWQVWNGNIHNDALVDRVPEQVYQDVDELLADGWIVD